MENPEKLTATVIAQRIAEVEGRALAGDPEAAHSAEKDLHRDVLEAIAAGARFPRVLARKALETREIDFDRWTA